MSDETPWPDDDATIDNADILSIETAVDSLLDQTQKNLGYPFDPSGSPTSKPSTTLSYSLRAEIEVSLDTDWPVIDGLALTNITLRTQVAKEKDVPGTFHRIDDRGDEAKASQESFLSAFPPLRSWEELRVS
jgi:hypothetical protein